VIPPLTTVYKEDMGISAIYPGVLRRSV